MKRAVIITVIAILFAPLCLYANGSRPKGKPASLLSVAVAPVDESLSLDNVSAGDVLELEVTLLSHADLEKVSLTVKLSGHIELLQGEVDWSGPLKSGGELLLPISVKILKKGIGKIKVRAFSRISETVSFSASDTFKIGRDEDKKPSRLPIKEDGKGRNIIEHRL
ncbi:MAG: hypothetical protein RQ824_07230 [bacterium]|nr:hypothetical protein [bacterium]